MTSLESFSFLAPGWLWLLPPCWWLVWLFSRNYRRHSPWSRICDPRLLAFLQRDLASKRNQRWLSVLLATIFTCGIVAAAGPSWRSEKHPAFETAKSRVLVLNLSRAMLVEDVRPNRFVRAKASARAILSLPYEGETGLVVFAGAAFVVTPLSRDANTLQAFLEALEPETMPLDGNRVDLAINSARELLEASVSATGHIIVITAAIDNPDRALQAALAARGQGHQISIVATGTRAGGPLIARDGGLLRDGNGKYILSRTDFGALERIAAVGDGAFMSILPSPSNIGLLDTNFDPGALIPGDSLVAETGKSRVDDGAWLILLMLPALLLLFRRNLLSLGLLAILLPQMQSLEAADWAGFWRHSEQLAHEAYSKEEYLAARELSSSPLRQGAAAYRLGLFQQAADYFVQSQSATGYYNQANALVQLQKYPEAIVAYQKALELDSGMLPAAANLELIEKYLEQNTTEGQGGDGGDDNLGDDSSPDASAETRIGVVGQNSRNPGDDSDSGGGSGASLMGGQFSPEDDFDGSEQGLEQYLLDQELGDFQQTDDIEKWISNLPEASSELFRRKFLRDYERQKQQPR